VLQSPQVDFGYDISDFTKVDPIFGSNEDLYELFREAKKLGIKVIMDFVSKSRERGFENFYVWHDGYPSVNNGRPLRPNNWVSE
jgi:alpha-glucosidase